MYPLPSEERRRLLETARRALIAAVQTGFVSDGLDSADGSRLIAGAFVTLHRRGRLRGCIGQIGKLQPVVPLVAYCARAAALEDPRFQPVQPREIPEVDIEISILSALEEITPDRIEVGTHGLFVTRGRIRGLLLPQVAAQYGWSAQRFLEETCVKAGLDRDAWNDGGTRVEAFTAEVFAESELVAAAPGALRRPRGLL